VNVGVLGLFFVLGVVLGLFGVLFVKVLMLLFCLCLCIVMVWGVEILSARNSY